VAQPTCVLEMPLCQELGRSVECRQRVLHFDAILARVGRVVTTPTHINLPCGAP
jgi:hypothetical protein